MAKGATARRIDEVPTEQTWLPGFSGGPPSPPPSAPTAPAVSNARLGLLVFLGAEAMFFVGLIGAFLVFRLGSEVWPPPAQPRLPVGVTGINTVILLFSGLTGHLALRAVREGDSKRLIRWILTTVLGAAFLACGIQLASCQTVATARRLLFASLVYLPVILLVMAMDRVLI